MATFNYRQDVSIPRIVFGRGLAKNLERAEALTEHNMVKIDGFPVMKREDGELLTEPYIDVDAALDFGEHTVTVIEHKEEVMTQAKTPPSKANPAGTEEKWEWVTVPEKSAEFTTIPVTANAMEEDDG